MINIFLFSYISSIYLICAGYAFLFNKAKKIDEIYTPIFFGSFFLAIIGLILNFFISLDVRTNSILFILIIIVGFFLIIKSKNIKKILFYSFLISVISTLILSYDTIYRPDANLYHLPFTQIINENKIIFGISNIHFRFGHISILQYLNALFNNIVFGEVGILIPAAIIFSTSVLYFYNEITKNFHINASYSFYIFLTLAYILYGYNRYSEFGNDTIAHLYFLLLSSYFLKKIYQEDISKENFIKIIVLSLFCFMLKTSLIFAFLIPLYIFLFQFKKQYLFNSFNILIIAIVTSWIIKNLITSGCIIYPIQITCFENLDWYTNNTKNNISSILQSLDNEAWTKGWPDYKGEYVTQERYVENFFWIKTWAFNHGFLILKKLSVFITIIFIICIILKNKMTSKNLLKVKTIKNLNILFFISLFCVIVWFTRFPVFRYGSSYIVVFIISISTLIATRYNLLEINKKKFQKFLNSCLIIFFVLFCFKHFLRIYKNYYRMDLNNAWPQFPMKKNDKNISEKIFINQKFVYYLLKDKDGCGYTSSPCTPYPIEDNIYLKSKKGYKFILIKN